MSIFNDQFYTTDLIAKRCIDKIPNLNEYSSIIEPSAGTGSFSKNFKNIFNSLNFEDFTILSIILSSI